MAPKGNLKRETESLLIAAQNNAKRTNYIKTEIDLQQRFGLVSLFNGISTFEGYLMPKLYL